MIEPRPAVTAILVSGLLVLGGCGDDDSAVPASPATSTMPSATPTTTTPTGAPQDTSDPAVADAVFLTAVDRVLSGTVYEGLVDESPGDFLLAADGVCDRLDAGDDPDRLLADVLTALGEARNELGDDDAFLAGALLGAAVEVHCPEHGDRLPDEVPS